MAVSFPNIKITIEGDVGKIEIAAHVPVEHPPRAIAVVAHPHPLYGGTMDNKVVTTIARAYYEAGAATYRFNFRGIGATSGVHDNGLGETADMLRVIAHVQTLHPNLPLWLAGFSFGGAVALAASEHANGSVAEMVLIAPATARLAEWPHVQAGGKPPESAIIIHGDKDETVPLVDSFDWARPRNIPVVVVPDADHFFHQRLHIIKRLVSRLASNS